MVVYIIGVIISAEAVLLLLPAAVALCYREYFQLCSFLISSAILLAVGAVLILFKPKRKAIYSRDGFLTVALGWIVLSIGGALPFVLTGEIPSFIDAFFESVSGFTTTGASILTDIESLSYASLFWRSFTHWVGGMGFLVFIMAALPLAGSANIHLMRAEIPGPDVSKLVPTSRGTSMRLYGIYLAITVLEVVLLLVAGNSVFDALTISFGTAGTGGFAIKNTSLAVYNSATQIIVTVFMAAFGVNFGCYYLLISRKLKDVFKNEELRVYFGVIIASGAVIAYNIYSSCAGVFDAVKTSFFQVVSVMTTTGYTTVNYDTWPELSRMIMIVVMCLGACTGSTGGGIKIARIVILFKDAVRRVKKVITPGRVETVRMNGAAVGEGIIAEAHSFIVIYLIIFVVSVLLVSIDGKDTVSNVSGVIATVNNIGPGLGAVGAVGNYGSYGVLAKAVFIFDMLAGRLEFIPLIAILSRRTWRN